MHIGLADSHFPSRISCTLREKIIFFSFLPFFLSLTLPSFLNPLTLIPVHGQFYTQRSMVVKEENPISFRVRLFGCISYFLRPPPPARIELALPIEAANKCFQPGNICHSDILSLFSWDILSPSFFAGGNESVNGAARLHI